MLQEKPSAKTAIMTVNAGSTTTKTAINEVDSKNYTLTWTAGDAIACYEVSVVESTPTVQNKVTSSALAADAETASFTFDLSGNNGDPNYSYIFVYPAAKYTKNTGDNPIYRAQIPENQTFSATSFDKNADILISRAITNQVERPTSVNAEFERIGATALMNIKAPTKTEKIRSITFSTTEGNLWGYVKVYPVEGTHDTDIYSGGKSLTLTPASSTTYSGTIPVWFRLGEITLSDNFTVKVTTDKKIYTKEVDLAGASRTIEFHNSGLTKFNVNMESVAGVDNPSLDGDYLIGSYYSGKWHLMSSDVHSNNYYERYESTVTKVFESVSASDFIAAGINTNDYCWKVEEDANGYSIKSYKTGKYVSLTNNSNNAYAADALDDEGFSTYFTFSVDDDITTITSTKFGTRYLRFNSGSPRFAFYASNGSNISLIPCDYENRTRVSAPSNVQVSASGSTITVIWDDASDANIDHYLVTLSGDADDSQNVAVGDEGCEFTGLSDGTYSVSVTAISNDHSAYLDSEATIIDNIVVGDPKGTIENPYTASEILTNYPAGSGDNSFYVSGTITNIQEVSTAYGNATYTINDGVNSILVYRGNYLNNATFTSASQIAVNNQVIVYGKIGVHNNTPQLAQGNYLYSLNGKTKVLTAGTVTATPDNANKQITVAWTAATGSDETISYHVTCGTQYYDANAAGSYTFTMADYGTYDVTVVASASDAISATVSTSATLSDSAPQDYTTTWIASSGALGSGIGSGSFNTKTSGSDATQAWSYTRTLISGSSYTGWTSNCIQLGKNGGVENITLSTSNIPGTIKSVSVECSSYQGKHNVSISVGETTYLSSTATATWTAVGAKSGEGTSSGTITISFTGGTRALYIKSITVVYNN